MKALTLKYSLTAATVLILVTIVRGQEVLNEELNAPASEPKAIEDNNSELPNPSVISEERPALRQRPQGAGWGGLLSGTENKIFI